MNQPVDGSVEVKIHDDGLAAYLQIKRPAAGGQPATPEAALEAIRQAGVIFGHRPEAVAQAFESGTEQPVLVAVGEPPIHGEDGRIEWAPFLVGDGQVRPKVRDDGGTDYRDLGLVINTPKGTLLGRVIPPTPGRAGTSVLGKQVAPRVGKPVQIIAGQGVLLQQEGTVAVAANDGHAVLDGRKVSVYPLFTVSGDVDVSTGDIDFIGSVVVRGSVKSGFTVKAAQDIEVQGGVDRGILLAQGDITIRYGILGGGRGRIEGQGNLKAKFIENAEIAMGGDVTVTDGILHSQVFAGGKIVVTSRRGGVVGGSLKARDELAAAVIGASLATATEVEVGILPAVRVELENIKRQLKELDHNLTRAGQAVTLLRELERRTGGLPKEKRDLLLSAMRTQYQLGSQQEMLRQRQGQLETELANSQLGVVRAREICYPGVRITIGRSSYQVTDPLPKPTFYLNADREVVWGR